MKLIVCCVMVLVILGESYCKSTTTVNKTSTSWGYDYSLSDTRGFKVKHDDKGYQFEPYYNNTSSGLKKHYNSRSVYDQFTSPGTNSSQSESSTYDGVPGAMNGNINTRTNGTVPHKVLLDTSADEEQTTEFRTIPITKTQTVTVTETQTDAPTDPSPSQEAALSPSVPVNGPLYKTTFRAPYGSQNTPMYGPLYYPPTPLYGPPASGPVNGLPNGQMYGSARGPMYGQPTGPMYGQPTGPMYGQPTGPMYGQPTSPMYGYAPQASQMYGPQNGQIYRPQNGQMYGSQSGQTYGYPTRSLYGSYRNY